MKKIIIVLCCLLVAIVPIFTVNNVSYSYAYVPGSPNLDSYFNFNIPVTAPIEEEFWEQSGFMFGSYYIPLYQITDNLVLNNQNEVSLACVGYATSYNSQTGFYDVYISLFFNFLLYDTGYYDFSYITYKYSRTSITPVIVDYVSSNWSNLWGEDFSFIYPDYKWYANSQFLTDYNALTSDQKMIIDKFFTWQQYLDTPILTLDFATIDWQPVQSATSYIIYKDNEYYITVSDSQFVTVVNGSYYVVAVDSSGTYANSSNSNTINVTVYNDDVGNGTNFFSLFSAIIDAQLHLFRSMLDWNILGINLLTLFKIILTIFLIVLVIKFILGKK